MKKTIKSALILILSATALIFSACVIHAESDSGKYVNYFSDVPEDSWYTEATAYCYKYGYMSGTGDAIFAPSSDVTRAMFVTILYSVDCADFQYTQRSFADVGVKWYTNPIEWAYANGYTAGTEVKYRNNFFSPDAPVTRESLCVFLRTYAKAKGYDVSAMADISKFTDVSDVHAWAYDAVAWAVENGIMSGTGGNRLSPTASATRAQIAQVFKMFLSKYPVHSWETETVISERACDFIGTTEFICADCGISKTVSYKPWHVFEKGEITTPPTCAVEGSREDICRFCGRIEHHTVPRTQNHVWDNGKPAFKSTCISRGYYVYICKVCGKERYEYLPLSNEHIFENGHCIYCTAINNATDLIVGDWTPVYIVIGNGEYYTQNRLSFSKNGNATFVTGGKRYDMKWQFLGTEGRNVVYKIYRTGEEYLVLFNNNPETGDYMRLSLIYDNDMYEVFMRQNNVTLIPPAK